MYLCGFLSLALLPPFVCGLAPATRLRFKKLSADAFRHPLDRSSTALVQQSPFLRPVERIVREQVLPLVEEAVALDNLANAVKVGPNQMPQLHDLLTEAAEILDMKSCPDLYVKQNPQPNAYTMAMAGERPFIVVHSSLLALCNEGETQAVLAHELGHLKAEHGIWLSLGSIASTALSSMPVLGDALDAALTSQLQEWQRAAEYSCDRAALLVTQDSAVVVSALLKLVGGGVYGTSADGQEQGLSAEAFLEQAEQYSEALSKARPAVRASFSLANAPRTHPLTVLRISEVDRWAKGSEFHGLVRRASDAAA